MDCTICVAQTKALISFVVTAQLICAFVFKGWISQVCKLNVVAQKRSGKPRKSWDELLLYDRKKLGMDNADPQNRSEWRARLRRL